MHQIVSRAVASVEIIDIFAAAGLKKPDLAILSTVLEQAEMFGHEWTLIEGRTIA